MYILYYIYINIKKLLQHSDKSFRVHNTLFHLRCLQSSFEILNQNFFDYLRENELKRQNNTRR